MDDQAENKLFSKLKKIEGGDQSEIDVLTPTKLISSGLDSHETITRLESKMDKLSSEINKCYDVITLLFNTIMSSNNVSLSSKLNAPPTNITTNITTNIDNESNTSG